MKKIADNFKNLYFVNVSDDYYTDIYKGIYQGTIDEIKEELSSIYGGKGYTLEITQCVADELPYFEDEI